MMSAKMATPGLLKIRVFRNKGFDVLISVDDIINKIFSRDSNYIVHLFILPKFDNSSISMREVTQPQFYKDLTRKTAFFEGCSWFKFNNLGLALSTKLKFYTNVTKG